MKKIVDFCQFYRSIECRNTIDIDEYNCLFFNKTVNVVFNNFSLQTHPPEVKLSINIDKECILKLNFNYLKKFYGYDDKWENSLIRVFYQEEVVCFKELDRNIVLPLFTLYDQNNGFVIKSSNLYRI